MGKGSILLKNLEVKNIIISNRYACAPFDIATATEDGLITDKLLSIYEQRKGLSLMMVKNKEYGTAAERKIRLGIHFPRSQY